MSNNFKLTLTVLSLLLLTISSYSQNALGIYGSANYGNLIENSDIDFFDSDFSSSFGIIYMQNINDKVDLVYQMGYEKMGSISKNHSDLNPTIDLYWKRNSINLFFGANYDFLMSEKFKLGLLLLPKLSYVYNQQYRIVEDQSIGITEFYCKKNVLLGVNTKLNLAFSISSLVDIQVRPGFSFTSYFDNNEYINRIWSIDFVIVKKL